MEIIPSGNTILFVSPGGEHCGVYQYGRNIMNTLVKSKKYNFVWCECRNNDELMKAVTLASPAAIIYNYYPATMPWLNMKITRSYKGIIHIGIIHEFTQATADKATAGLFDYHLYQDPDLIERNPIAFKTKQLIYPYVNTKPLPAIPTIGSFGFAFPNKGFERLVTTVQEEFDIAHINISMPFNEFSDRSGNRFTFKISQRCRDLIYKPGINLNIYHDFKTEPQLLDFLAANTINAFLYDVDKGSGISGVIQHALAVHRPIAITRCQMFKNVLNAEPSICIEDSSLKEIMNRGIEPLVPYYEEWSEEYFIKNYEDILDRVL